MSINQNVAQGQWKEIKGEVLKVWGKLTDDELEKTKGDMMAISGIIQKKYGENQIKASERLNEIVRRFQTKKDEAVQSVKKSLKN